MLQKFNAALQPYSEQHIPPRAGYAVEIQTLQLHTRSRQLWVLSRSQGHGILTSYLLAAATGDALLLLGGSLGGCGNRCRLALLSK